MALEISEARAKEFDKLEGTSVKILQQYLDDERPGDDKVVTARNILNTIKGNRQTDTSRQGLRYAMVTDLNDPELLKKYVAATQPEIRKLKAGK